MTLEGWAIVVIDGYGIHCVPVNDLKPHLDENCPCRPEKDEDNLWNHHSYDGREKFETGERLVS
jgi:hypothetical protein